ncbi:MAG: DtxR family transcriptional regulator [Gemmatimonadetes bacterium]|nr:DtxR family transcriptional regulator [Gemmatimonadota bacterium]NNM07130.1 DtxR family transcriptional regulator [Gemmatimonadota bacterium]
MVDPALALVAFGILCVVAVFLFWPNRGLVSRILRLAGMSERVRLEDALKHLYKGEYSGRPSTVESVAGSVGVSRARALHLLSRLEELGYARAVADGFELSDQGRDYALHIVRTHRLLERYLADRTGVLPQDWHGEAERREHRYSPEDRESLAAKLGHPVYDPHGDPIPTASGDLPPLTGVPITVLDPGEVASVVHLGDEPKEVYETLTRAGLSPLMAVKVLEGPPGEVWFEAGGEEHRIPAIIARNITVEPLPEAELDGAASESLADVGHGETVRVLGIHSALQGPQRRRLLDLGLVPGTLVEAELDSAGGDPVAYRIRGALIALRRDQSRWIQVDRRVEA